MGEESGALCGGFLKRYESREEMRYYGVIIVEGGTSLARKKKLKKIPYDLVSYIQIETETIEDADDKMMIASYCLGKLQLVEWYIQLIDTNNPNYIVPQTREQLVMVRDQLKECHKEIMKVKIKRPGERPLFDIRYLDE